MRLLLSFLIIGFLSLSFVGTVAAVWALPGSVDGVLGPVSINVSNWGGTDIYSTTRGLGLQILRWVKLLVSGIALIWLVILGANMVVFSENEEKIKSQRTQITYMLIGFLFLNIPSLVYTIFFWDTLGSSTISGEVIWDSTVINFWDAGTFLSANGFLYQLIWFFEVFIFGVAILMFTYGFFRLMLSAWDEEVRKKARNQITYGILALLFVSFVRYWGTVIAKGDFFQEYATIGGKILGLALYFAPPVAIGFLVYAAFMMITSWGDEERVKKAKSIFLNVFIAALILLWVYSFVSDLANFSL
jgi:predicted nucleic acid-binding Zn ribbon protein